MDAQATQPPSGSSAYPPWVLLKHYGNREDDNADAKTLAAARTSTASSSASPSSSRRRWRYSVLIDVYFSQPRRGDGLAQNYFVYNAGAAAAGEPPRPPPLSLLPPCYLNGYLRPPEGPVQRRLDKGATGLVRLRRGGDDELAVAELRMVPARGDSGQQPARKVPQPQLVLLRSGEWSTRRPPPVGRAVPSCWWADKVVPVDGGLLCWMDLISGIVFSDVFADKPGLRYVPLPTDYSLHHRTIHTWTLSTDAMAWVMDGVVDAAELWALDAYRGLPRVQLRYPVVSADDPHAICFVVEGDGVWLIMLDTGSKTLQSVERYTEDEDEWFHHTDNLTPSKVSDYLNSHPSSSNGDTPPPPPPVVADELRIQDDVKKNQRNLLRSRLLNLGNASFRDLGGA
ncbi:hypothetical protein PVAP13_8KG097400 [Panicum virgatum]|uniref:DUF1618 domain-containing protein n=1 Tax=Panicum virgatum TaxID=38727 RepID=A0A8T0PE64_PANVG|nr:hypothetical protein PVAP13_8KG097400 [Panicum virgatum]